MAVFVSFSIDHPAHYPENEHYHLSLIYVSFLNLLLFCFSHLFSIPFLFYTLQAAIGMYFISLLSIPLWTESSTVWQCVEKYTYTQTQDIYIHKFCVYIYITYVYIHTYTVINQDLEMLSHVPSGRSSLKSNMTAMKM